MIKAVDDQNLNRQGKIIIGDRISPTRNQELYQIQRKARSLNQMEYILFFSFTRKDRVERPRRIATSARLVYFPIFTEIPDINFNKWR